MKSQKIFRRNKRRSRIRKRIFGTNLKPRLSVFRSNKNIYAQAIDDEKKITIASFSTLNLAKKDLKGGKKDCSVIVGEKIGELLKKKKVNAIVFDRGGRKYHGRIESLAQAVRKTGIKF